VTEDQRQEFLALARKGFETVPPKPGQWVSRRPGHKDIIGCCGVGAAAVAKFGGEPGDPAVAVKSLGLPEDYTWGVQLGFDMPNNKPPDDLNFDEDAYALARLGHADGVMLRREAEEKWSGKKPPQF
jgi:hypothetical protein